MANYGLTFTVDAPYLLQEGVDVDDFPVLVKIPIANTTNLYDVGETGDTIYFESEGEILKHELIEINATYAIAWVKMDLEAATKKVVTLHYGALVDNNYEDKRGVWVNASHIFHFNGSPTDTMGNITLTPSDGTIVYGTSYGIHYQGMYIPGTKYLSSTANSIIQMPWTIIMFVGCQTAAATIALVGQHTSASNLNYIAIGDGSIPRYNLALKKGDIGGLNWVATSDTKYPMTLKKSFICKKSTTGTVASFEVDGIAQSVTTSGTIDDSFTFSAINRIGTSSTTVTTAANITWAELLIFHDTKSTYWTSAFYRHYNNPDAYIEYGTEVDLDNLTALDIDKADCVANVTKQLGIYDVDFRNIMYEIGDYNATWRLPGTEGITIWGIYQPRPVGDYYFPEMDNLGINDALFFTVTDYLVDIHDKIDIEGVRFDLQAIQVHPIADQKIYKMCVLKRQPEYYATCKGVVS